MSDEELEEVIAKFPPDPDMEAVSAAMDRAAEFGMYREVCWSMVQLLRGNPKATPEELYSFAVCEWDL